MKIKISESKIRRIVNEEVLKSSLNKTMAEQKWPNYSAYLLAEVLKLEWESTLTESNSEQKPSPEWIAETASAFGLSDKEIQEATDVMNNDELEEGVGGFLKAIAKPYQNIWKTFTNITQHAADFTDPEAKKAAGVIDQVDDKIPDPKKLQNQDPEDVQALLRQILDLLQKADQGADLDAIKPGLEDEIDQAVDQIDTAVDQGGAEGGGGQTAAIYKGKGGKGLQSFLARGSKQAPKLQGKAMGAVLKHIEKQLKAQGVTVSEGVLDEVQGWMWYGLVEDMIQEHYGTKITIQEILSEVSGLGRKSAAKGKGSLSRTQSIRRARQQKAQRMGLKGNIAGEEPAAEVPEGMDPDDANCAPGTPGTNNFGEGTGKPCDEVRAEFYGAEAAPDGPDGLSPDTPAEEAPIEEVPPTVKNTAPEGSPLVKVFKGKGGEGLQSALAKNRDALGIDQQTVSVIIKSVEEWANANQIKVENVSAETFDTIISEIFTKYKVRKLQEVIYKLRS